MDVMTLKQEDLPAVLALYRSVTVTLRKQGIHQWDRFYPNRFVVKTDMRKGCLYGIRDGNRIMAAVAVNEEQSSRYAKVNWSDDGGSPAVIHRLAVHPDIQGKGVGKRLLQYAEHIARIRGHSSIRLDVYSANPGALALYERYGYLLRGTIRFPFRKAEYLCMEKVW